MTGTTTANDPRTPAERRPWLHEEPESLPTRSERGVDPPSPVAVGLPPVSLAVAVLAQLLAVAVGGVSAPTATAGYLTAAVGYALATTSGTYVLVRAVVAARG